ncbi:hypothetical protein GOEFS_069_00260 [Gordonia effusa NBRC 100432]|uniref:Uncharacterized protein n=1 Tax=Gordonia effusa NBRC 100432 TaxID=1077974 RepID=H0R1E9_9ACTN|nr:hypothetical protein [Gordonia effusa]GAB18900.1 hypothetical protein GOEFS_069_00260 [Gordonia effusa NBRC 100432]
MTPAVQAVLLPIVVAVFGWRLAVLLTQSRSPSQRTSNPTWRTVQTVYLALVGFAVSTYFGLVPVTDVVYHFHVWLIWLQYLAVMLLVRALAEAYGVAVSGHLAVIAFVAVVTACFAAVTPVSWTGRFVDAPASLLWLYALSAAAYIPVCLLLIGIRIVAEPKPRGSMWVSTVAMILATGSLAIGFVLNAVEFGIYLNRELLPPGIEPLSRALLDAGLLLLIIGTLTPALVSRAAYLRRTFVLARELRAMRKLAGDIAIAIPQLGAAPWPRRPISPAGIRLAHYRRYILIRDGLMRLSEDLGVAGSAADVGSRLRTVLREPIPSGRETAIPVLAAADDDVRAVLDMCAVYNRISR